MSEKAQYYKQVETGEIVSITHIISDEINLESEDGSLLSEDVAKFILGDERYSIPIDSNNMDYVELMKRVDAGKLTIAPAEEE